MLSLQTVPLKLLCVSPLNVRTSNADEDIPALAADIAAHGLKQNLVVVPQEDGRFGVVAGGRRLRALWHNADAHLITLDEPIAVLIEEPAEGRATSLSENLHKVAMNPADEFVAYATIVAEHGDEADPVAYAARRFGVTERHVAQRLRLAALAPEILDALRAGALRQDAANAYAGVADQDLQLSVFRAEEARVYGVKHSPHQVRDSLRQRTYPATVKQAVFVGLEAYARAGGRLDRDLFMGAEDGDRLLDPSLLDQLARDKAAAELPALFERDGFEAGRLAEGFTLVPILPKAPPMTRVVLIAADFRKLEELPLAERARSTGIYALANDGSGLSCVGWWTPLAQPGAIPVAVPAPVTSAALIEAEQARVARAAAPIADAAAGARLRQVRQSAARLAVERIVGAALEGRAFWPSADGFVPSIAPVEGDDDTILVAVQIRIPRAEWEAALPEAETAVDAAA